MTEQHQDSDAAVDVSGTLYGCLLNEQWLTQGGHYIAETSLDAGLVLSLLPGVSIAPLPADKIAELGTVSWTGRWLEPHRAWLARTGHPTPEERAATAARHSKPTRAGSAG